MRSALVDGLQARGKKEAQTGLAEAMVVEVQGIGVHCNGLVVEESQGIEVHCDGLMAEGQEIGVDDDRPQCLAGEQLLGEREDLVA